MRIDYDNKPISIYDVDNKKLVGVFRTHVTAQKYIFNNGRKDKSLYKHIVKKYKCHKTILSPIVVCFRRATDEQIQLLGESDYFINEGYPNPIINTNGFVSTNLSLAKNALEKTIRYGEEVKRINKNNKLTKKQTT